MAFDFIKLCEDNQIEYLTKGNRHCTEGWVQIHCVMCDSSKDFHLGFNIESSFFRCWRCGSHRIENVCSNLLSVPQNQVRIIIRQYFGNQTKIQHTERSVPDRISLPEGCQEIKNAHREYLENRNFDPEKIRQIWDIKGTGHTGNYKFRIIAPINFKNQLVSYQGRDITGKAKSKYKACSKNLEIIPHQEIVYGFDLVPNDTAIVCEGIIDAWRLGPGAVATFGMQTSIQQSILLAKFKRVFIFFDSEKDAENEAEKLASRLSNLNVEANIITIEKGDPADLSQNEADEAMKEILK